MTPIGELRSAFPQTGDDHMTEFKDLTSGERDALKRIENGRWYRVPGGWRLPGRPMIRRFTGDSLISKGLASEQMQGGKPRLAPTAYGLRILDTSRQQKETA
jgi:hypothetical protein